MRTILTNTSIVAPSKDLYLVVGTKDDPATQRCISPSFTKPNLKQHHQRSATKRPLVRFQNDVTVMEGAPTDHEVCSMMLWYTHEDYTRFKEIVISDVQAAMRNHGSHKRSRNDDKGSNDSAVSKIKQAFAVTLESEVLREPPTGVDLDPYVKDEMSNIHFHDCLEIVGLERFLSKKICRDKRNRRSHLTHAVLQLQALFRLSGQNRFDQQQATMIRRASERFSDPSKLMAWYLGEGTRNKTTSTTRTHTTTTLA